MIREIEERLEKIEKNETKFETLYNRVDNLENLNSRYNNNNVESQAVTNHNTIDLENNQGKEVNIFFNF